MELKTFQQVIQQIAEEKSIPAEKVIETLELALAAAYKKDYGKKGQIIKASFDRATGAITFRQVKIVVDDSMIKSEEEIKAEEEARAKAFEEAVERGPVRKKQETEEAEIARELGERKVRFNPERHLTIEEAKEIKPDVEPGEELEFPLETHSDFGRIASQTAKQVIIQRIREAERESTYDEYKSKEGEIVSGIIQRIEGRNVFVDLGRGIGLLPPEEQIPREYYRIGERVKALVIGVEKDTKGPGIFLSRTHPRLLKKLFEIEVPEISAGSVEIKAVAREPGSRSKVAAVSNEQGVDPVGSLVGQKGVRVSTVINEINGEKIDIIEWSEDPAEFIAHAISPAKATSVELAERERIARIIVPADQLSLAIGRGGQNVRLAAKLTGWKIDVRSGLSEGASATPEGETEIAAETTITTAPVPQEPEKIVDNQPETEKKNADPETEKPKKKKKSSK
ncbi:MAG: transcription termination/antitermination protein NusA [Candidatus Sungbacteria bacterium]|nr:transcription termination/antitermination protein NusA [Candidatus Sungbacteria bacterium]